MIAERIDTIGADFRQLLGIRNRQAAQADRIDQLKDCGVCPDAEGERQDRNSGEDRSAPEQAQTVPGVTDQVVDDLDVAPIAAGLFVLLHSAHRAQCRIDGHLPGVMPRSTLSST